ncbi:MAG: T9SS type A sorting domain-containing protein [Bacteroidetes bacterium]|nr:T9SS type A sorting domain-containing protein [Bacteroidota bacterium]
MKKIYTFISAALLTGSMLAQPFFTPVTYKGAFPVTDGMTGVSSNDWTAGWAEWNPDVKSYPTTVTQTINSDITTNTTWTSSNVYKLVGNISVKNGAVLTIQPGTIIYGDQATKSCLIIAQGAKIIAQGTVANPIVFTSDQGVNNRLPGDWGGLIILGYGVTNTSCGSCSTNPNTNYIEGFSSNFPEILHGGNNNDDSSGVLSYVRIEYAGVALSSASNSEINGLTMGSVGRKTKIDHIQVSYSGDDSYEWFGGAVNAKYLIAFRGLDDDFDTDHGWAGNVQFGLAIRDKDISDTGKDSNGFESDNFDPGSGRTPLTSGIFSNITLVGPKRDGNTSLPSNQAFGKALRIRRNTSISTFNSIIVGWSKGVSIEGSATEDNFIGDSAVFANNLIVGASDPLATASNSFYYTFFSQDGNDTTQTVAQIAWVDPFPTALSDTADFRLMNNTSVAATGASFTDTKFSGLVINTGIREVSNVLSLLSVYPNPSSGIATIGFSLKERADVVIQVLDITGKVVYATELANLSLGNQHTAVDLSTAKAGIYFVAISVNGSEKQVSKLVVNN